MGLGILCPGQGAQHPAMLDGLAGDAAAQAVLDEAGAALGLDLRQAVRPPNDIFQNRIAQPLLCAAELATWAALRLRLPMPRAFAGYSVGELAAYGCAGALPATELVALARRRALLMDAAGTAPAGLLAVRGLSRTRVEALCRELGAEIAIVNGVDRFVVGAAREALAAVEAAASARGATVNRLPVDVASHTSRLAAASDGFRAALTASGLTAPAVPVLAGIHGMPVYDRIGAIEVLSRQVSTTIDWAACLETLREMGCTALLELGPGNGLSRMARERWPELPVRSVADFRSLQGVVDWIAKLG